MRIHVVDAFSARPFAGNPAGVCLLDSGDWPADRWMQLVAAEMRHAETAFARPLPDAGDADWELRWFTPAVEVELCGHATLATAHVLREERGITGTVRFRTRYSGVLTTHTEPGSEVNLDFPAARCSELPAPDGLAAALGAAPQATFGTGTLGDLLAVCADERTVRAARPDDAALAELTRREGFRGVIITAPADGREHRQDASADPPESDRGDGDAGRYDLVSRFFAPAQGIPEDPVTGSAHTALATYWADRLGRESTTGLQVSDRTGVVRMRLLGDRVELTGHAVTVLEGDLRA